MRFRVTNIRPGYCEVWANEYDGGRYDKMAEVKQKGIDGWRWCNYEELSRGFMLRRDCIADCIRTALIHQMELAIEQQPKESEFWHSPRRDALLDIWHSGYFSWDEKENWEEKAMTFEEWEPAPERKSSVLEGQMALEVDA